MVNFANPFAFRSSLRVRVIGLAVLFVLFAEVLIFLPSVANYRLSWLRDRLAEAHLAALSLDAARSDMVEEGLEAKLLGFVGVDFIDVTNTRPVITDGRRSYILSIDQRTMPLMIYDLREAGPLTLITDALRAFMAPKAEQIAVIGPSPKDPEVLVRVDMSNQQLCADIVAFGLRILALSIIISVITGLLLLLALNRLLIRPVRRISGALIAVGRDPEHAAPVPVNPYRIDEIGIALTELRRMQETLRDAFRQRARLAALGTAVTKINHDLRNMLSTASLVSERLAMIEDPEVKRVTPRLLTAIDRAIDLCEQTLVFAKSGAVPIRPEWFTLHDLVEDVGEAISSAAIGQRANDGAGLDWSNAIAFEQQLHADREQLFRVLLNLARNAVQAGAGRIVIEAVAASDGDRVLIRDNGPGIPASVAESLFEPFRASTKRGGTGLGLAIARELVRQHGGDLRMVETSAGGTVFALWLPRH